MQIAQSRGEQKLERKGNIPLIYHLVYLLIYLHDYNNVNIKYCDN